MNTEIKASEGYWWLPENPERKIAGSLSITLSGAIELKLLGFLRPKQVFYTGQFEFLKEEILLGQTADQKSITLVDLHCIKWDSDLYEYDISTSAYSARFAITGSRRFEDRNSINFTSAEVRLNLLDAWLCQSGFTLSNQADSRGYQKYELKYSFPEAIEFDIDFINSKFQVNNFFDREKVSLSSWQLSHRTFLNLTPKNAQGFDWYLKRFYSLQKLLVVMTGFPASITEIVGYGETVYIDANTPTKEIFQIYASSSRLFLETSEKHPSRLLTNLSLLNTELSVVMNSWFQKSEVLASAVDLYVATLSINFGYSEFKLLNYMQALEALHRNVFGGKYMTDKDYQSIREVLTKDIPEDIEDSHRESLKARIKYGNEFSQKKRIEHLLDLVWEGCLEDFIEDRRAFAKQGVDARNSLVHGNSASTSNPAAGVELFYLTERLRILLVTHILLQLDIPRESVFGAVKRFSEFSYLQHRHNHPIS